MYFPYFLPVAPMDYTALSTLLRFGRCEKTKCVTIAIVDDILPEEVESFNVTLEMTENVSPYVFLHTHEAVVQIFDKSM